MRWPVLAGKVRVQPTNGGYVDWKAQVADDCEHRCVFCSLHESEYGGIGNFHIDHFRPKKKFGILRDNIGNLHLSCAICNRFKSDDWPGDPAIDHSLPTYIDPAAADYNTLLTVDQRSFRVSAQVVAGKYTIERLYLNRPQMIRYWRLRFLSRRISEMEDFALQALNAAHVTQSQEAIMAAIKITEETIRISKAFRLANELPPYVFGETSRPH